MSVSKPAIADVRWAVDGANADAGNVVAPTSGLRDTGYPTNAIPTSGVENYMKNRPYRWFQYLDEVFKLAGTAIGDMKLTGVITAGGGFVAAANQHNTVSGTGRHKHGTMTLLVPYSVFIPVDNTLAYTYAPATGLTMSPVKVESAIVLPAGKRVTAIRFFVKDSATGPTTMRGRFSSIPSGGGGATIDVSSTSSGAGTAQTLTISPETETFVTGKAYILGMDNVAGSAAVSLYMAEVDYDHP
jgi:hypothetical protein